MNYWVAGADWDGKDKTPEFIESGIWQNGYTDKYLDLVKSIKEGDQIAIKAIYGQKHNIPFNNYNCVVSCMKIKVIGTVSENVGDGQTLKANWQKQPENEKVIYLYTYRPTIMRVVNKDVQKFIFADIEQDFSALEKFYSKRSESRKQKISDDFILRQFKEVLNFEYIEKNREYRDLFLQLARYIHESPMDWWITYSERPHQIRFGVNNNFNGRNSTNGYVAAVGFDQEGIFYRPNDLSFFSDETEIVRLTQAKLDELKNIEFTKMDVDRDPFVGYWPENYNNTNQVEEKLEHLPQIDKPLSRILFGAAGTGKTYHTINHALSIIENKPLEILEREDRTVLKERFDKYRDQGQIKFVTFHQSFSYEDFVEGIRAETDEGQLTYDVKPGVFKEICDIASNRNLINSNVEEVIQEFCDQISERPLQLKTKTGLTFEITYEGGKTLKCFLLESEKKGTYRLSLDMIKKLLNGVPLENYGMPSYIKPIVSLLSPKIIFSENLEKYDNHKPYVLIIDEINRGNISRIFGDLITLIEDSKRAGAEEALSVTLPYSKEEFSVPQNVYLIGTMNSSDRSLTGLDIALRRRFTFIEMPPKPELLNNVNVEGIDIQQLLTVINQRIEVLLDRDHCIGHANFMSLKKQPNLATLSSIFKQKIIPQLQEYFFDDWSKINMVLNANGMLQSNGIDKSALFPNVAHESDGYFDEQKTWEVVDDAFSSIESFTKIIKH